MSLEVLDIEKMIVVKQIQKTCKCIFGHYTSWLMKVNGFLWGFFSLFFISFLTKSIWPIQTVLYCLVLMHICGVYRPYPFFKPIAAWWHFSFITSGYALMVSPNGIYFLICVLCSIQVVWLPLDYCFCWPNGDCNKQQATCNIGFMYSSPWNANVKRGMNEM